MSDTLSEIEWKIVQCQNLIVMSVSAAIVVID